MMQAPMFTAAALAAPPSIREIEPGVRVAYVPGWYGAPDVAAGVLHALRSSTPWEQHTFAVPGTVARRIPLPRLTAWYGDRGATYRYSGITNEPMPWTPTLHEVRERVSLAVGELLGLAWEPTAVLATLYRNGDDSVSWHRDNEYALGDSASVIVASVSFGVRRPFRLRPIGKGRGEPIDYMLGGGDLLLMGPGAQVGWEHAAPKTPGCTEERINLTFRRVVTK